MAEDTAEYPPVPPDDLARSPLLALTRTKACRTSAWSATPTPSRFQERIQMAGFA